MVGGGRLCVVSSSHSGIGLVRGASGCAGAGGVACVVVPGSVWVVRESYAITHAYCSLCGSVWVVLSHARSYNRVVAEIMVAFGLCVSHASSHPYCCPLRTRRCTRSFTPRPVEPRAAGGSRCAVCQRLTQARSGSCNTGFVILVFVVDTASGVLHGT